jgi:acyl carrier protein
MDINEIEKKIKFILADKLGLDQDEIKNDQEIQKDLGADSLDNVEICMELEKEFNMHIPRMQHWKLSLLFRMRSE